MVYANPWILISLFDNLSTYIYGSRLRLPLFIKQHMEIVVRDLVKTSESTIGRMYIDGKYICDTLEDTLRPKGVKIAGKTAIPRGRYKVVWSMSQRFGKYMPEILSVPQFSGIRIHSGNEPKDTEGCILCGSFERDNWIGSSRAATSLVYSLIEGAVKRHENVWITLENE